MFPVWTGDLGLRIEKQEEAAMSPHNLVGIISDSHDNRKAIVKAVEIFNQRGVGMVFHAGDFIAPFTAEDFAKLTCTMTMVFGNNDGEKKGLEEKSSGRIKSGPYSLEMGGRKVALMHEFCETEADVIIHGHTHSLKITQGKRTVINPGEVCGWLTGKSSLVVFDLDKYKSDVVYF